MDCHLYWRGEQVRSRTERFTRYRHDPSNPNSLVADSVNSIARDSRGFLWFGTEASGLDKFDPSTGTFTHYLNDNDGQFVGRITHVIEGRPRGYLVCWQARAVPSEPTNRTDYSPSRNQE